MGVRAPKGSWRLTLDLTRSFGVQDNMKKPGNSSFHSKRFPKNLLDQTLAQHAPVLQALVGLFEI